MLFEEITASSLIKVDVDGNKLSESPYDVNKAGFTIHSAIHMGNHNADAVMHLHTAYGVGVSTQKQGLLPVTQMSLTALALVRYHDYEGVAFNLDERERLVKSLGDGGMTPVFVMIASVLGVSGYLSATVRRAEPPPPA